ncbi:hypothetical protein FRB98_008203 [Tulasnella sp. 332]|nr:hypothetical protein FRB98_008203 [Tulasnella sp. 332]
MLKSSTAYSSDMFTPKLPLSISSAPTQPGPVISLGGYKADPASSTPPDSPMSSVDRLPADKRSGNLDHIILRSSPVYIRVEETSMVMNVVLHTIYNISCARYAPTYEIIVQALNSLRKYGIVMSSKQDAEIWTMLLQHAIRSPNLAIGAYAICASHGRDDLCILTSRLTLTLSLDALTEADALTMGPTYLRRLFFLHCGRLEAIKRVIGVPPKPHLATPTCSLPSPQLVANMWEVATADVTLRPRAYGISKEELEEAFAPVLAQQNACDLCRDNVRDRIAQMVEDWLTIKDVI